MYIRNDDVVDRLSSDFQPRYEPNFAWKSVCAQYLALPGLRGFWPLSSFDETPLAYDMSEQARHLTATSGVGPVTYRFGYEGLIPYFDATEASPDYLWRADEVGLDIQGNEVYVATASQGITFGAWVKFDAAAAATDMIISKRDQAAAPAGLAYSMHRRVAGVLRASFSNGVAIETVDSTTVLADDTWYFTAGKWGPAASANERACYVNADKDTGGATALANLANIGAELQLMGRDDLILPSTENTDGKICLAFLCCMALPDATIWSLFQQSRAMFGV